jgi:hypothetical protein
VAVVVVEAVSLVEVVVARAVSATTVDLELDAMDTDDAADVTVSAASLAVSSSLPSTSFSTLVDRRGGAATRHASKLSPSRCISDAAADDDDLPPLAAAASGVRHACTPDKRGVVRRGV